MPKQKLAPELPEQQILEDYKNISCTPKRLAAKYETTIYRINKILTKHNVLRKTGKLQEKILNKFLKYEVANNVRVIPREKLLAQRLIAKCPDEAFWDSFELSFKLNSLAFLMGEKGNLILREKYAAFQFEIPQPEQHNMQEEKVGEDYQVPKKVLSLEEFLKKKEE